MIEVVYEVTAKYLSHVPFGLAFYKCLIIADEFFIMKDTQILRLHSLSLPTPLFMHLFGLSALYTFWFLCSRVL